MLAYRGDYTYLQILTLEVILAHLDNILHTQPCPTCKLYANKPLHYYRDTGKLCNK